MTQILNDMLNVRKKMAEEFLHGKGIEIGGLDAPLDLPGKAEVQYVDRLGIDKLLLQYPELAGKQLVGVDIIDDGERLNKIPDESLDFIVANHMLEHCENPLGTLRNFFNKIKNGGVVYCAIPDKRLSFDITRDITTFDHLIADDLDWGEKSRFTHYMEWARDINKLSGEDAKVNAQKNLENNYSIHFHVWDCQAFSDFLNKTRAYLDGCFEILYFQQNNTEVISILRKCA